MLFELSDGENRPSTLIPKDQHAINNKLILDSITENTFRDRAFGCILGAFVSDSCGSYNEFSTRVATEDFMNDCMQMKGGGPWNLCAGQITDDSELAMSLMNGLLESVSNDQNLKVLER